MSSVFVEVGILVLAAFALGVMVGWLAFGGGQSAKPDLTSRTDANTNAGEAGPTMDGLPQWRGQSLPSDARSRRPRPIGRRAPGQADRTVVVRPRGEGPRP